jgi:hypothetical protein
MSFCWSVLLTAADWGLALKLGVIAQSNSRIRFGSRSRDPLQQKFREVLASLRKASSIRLKRVGRS